METKLEKYQEEAIKATLPGLGSWVMKHRLQERTIMQLSYEEMLAFIAACLRMYEREMGKALNPSGEYENPESVTDDEIPF